MLSNMVSQAGLDFFPSVALVIFLMVFVVIVWRLMRPANQPLWQAMAQLPLDDASESGVDHEQ